MSSSDIEWYSKLHERFEVVQRLGRGAGSSVFRVRDLWHDNVELALKVLRGRISQDALQRFYRELRLTRSLDHPNLVRAYHFIVLDRVAAYTMEFVDGENLGILLDRDALKLSMIEPVFDQLLSALALLHQHSLVHRDLKLENVLLRRDGTVKLSDLGVAAKLNYASGRRQLCGTPGYLPPEYVKYDDYDERGDVYAAGVLLYELLTGQRRLQDESAAGALKQLLKTNFALPEEPLAGLPEKYVNAVRRATAVDPRQRYRSVAAMRVELIDGWAE